MFHWICPECGREIMPSMKECPACDGSQAEVSAAAMEMAEAPPILAVPPPIPAAAEPVAVLEAVAPEPVAPEPAKVEPPPDPLLAVAEQLRSLQSQNGKLEAKAHEPEVKALAPEVAHATEPERASASPEPPQEPEPPIALETLAQEAALPEAVLPETGIPEIVIPETIASDAAATARDLAALASINEPSVAPAPVHQEAAVAQAVEAHEPALVPVAAGPAPSSEDRVPEMKLLAAPAPAPELLPAPITEAIVAQEPVAPTPVTEALVAPEPPLVEEAPAIETKPAAETPESTLLQALATALAPAEPPVAAAPVEAPKVELPAEPEAISIEAAKVEPPAPEPAFVEPKRLAASLDNPKFSPRTAKAAPLPTAESESAMATPTAPTQALHSDLQYATPAFAVAPPQDHTTPILRRMKPAVAAQQVRGLNGAPQLTLPGPSLPPQLNSVTEGLSAGVGPSNPAPTRAQAAPAPPPPAPAVTAGVPVAKTAQLAAVQPPPGKVRGWFVSLSVMAALLTAGGAAIYWALPPQTLAKVKPAKPEPATFVETTAAPTTPTPPTAPSNSLSKQIEVAGIRFIAQPNKKPEIHYLVVNHSPVVLSDMTVYVTLRMGSAKPGEPPLSRFSFRAPNVPAFESKEMSSTIEKVARELTFPEWQDVKAEITVGK